MRECCLLPWFPEKLTDKEWIDKLSNKTTLEFVRKELSALQMKVCSFSISGFFQIVRVELMHKDKSEQIIQFDQFGGVTRKMLTCFPVAHITMNRASYKNNGTICLNLSPSPRYYTWVRRGSYNKKCLSQNITE